MGVPDLTNDVILVARTRSRMYALLALAFDYPTAEFYHALESRLYPDGICDIVAALYPDLGEEVAAVGVTLGAAPTLLDQQSEYLETFETAVPKPAAALYEGLGGPPGERADILLELKAFLRRFGLKMNDALREFEDSATAELEFMQFLAMKEAEALENGWDSRPYRHAQHDFLARHPGRWLPGMARSAREAKSVFYRSVAQIAAMFVERDEIGIRPGMCAGTEAATDGGSST